MRTAFAKEITNIAETRKDVVLLSGDIGNRMFDNFKLIANSRFFNCGIAESNMMSVASGMALCGLRPIIYTITPFLIERPFEQIKLDIDQQNVNVNLVGFADYPNLGPTHSELDAKKMMGLFKNIKSFFPKDSKETETAVFECWKNIGPNFISLKSDKQIGKNW